MVPALTLPGCPPPLGPVCTVVGGAGSSLAGSAASAVLSAMAGWVVTGAAWLLTQIGAVMASSTRIDLSARWFTTHYAVMAGIAMAVALPLLLLAAVQAVYRQSPSVLARAALVQVPLAALLTGAAIQLVQLSLVLSDVLCSTVAAGTGNNIDQALSGLAGALVDQAAGGPSSPPLFVAALGALLVAGGALLLWLELLVRASAVYVAVLFLPLALVSLVWPSVTHWCRRLVDTLVALVLSKFVIVSILSMGAGALAAGTANGFTAVLSGGALLLLAAFTPFVLLRLIPLVEAGAAHQLEGARQRVRRAALPVPGGAATLALRTARDWRQPALDPGQPGTLSPGSAGPPMLGPGGTTPGTPNGQALAGGAPASAGERDHQDRGGGEAGIPHLGGDPASVAAFHDAVTGPGAIGSGVRGTGGVLPGRTMLPLWTTPAAAEGSPDEQATLAWTQEDPLGAGGADHPPARWSPAAAPPSSGTVPGITATATRPARSPGPPPGEPSDPLAGASGG